MFQRLVIVSHVVHYQYQGRLYAYGPYAREIDIWAELFPDVLIASPCHSETPPGDAVAFTRSNISIWPITETGGNTWAAKTGQILMLPLLIGQLVQATRQADVIHVRCPGNLGLLGVLLAPLFSRYRIAKYAGQWNGYLHEPWSVQLQRLLLASCWWNAPVTVYGQWPEQPAHVVPFFTSMMSTAQMERAVEIAGTKRLSLPLRILFSGRLVSAKRVDALIEAIALLRQTIEDIELVIVGDGPERDRLNRLVDEQEIRSLTRFTGALSYDQALGWYAWAHCLVLPSTHSEGWPKVVAEAMAHGLLTFAVNHGQVAAMLTNRGVLLQTGSAPEIARALQNVIEHPTAYEQQMRSAAVWAQQFTLEGLRTAIRELLVDYYALPDAALLPIKQPE